MFGRLPDLLDAALRDPQPRLSLLPVYSYSRLVGASTGVMLL